MYETSSEFMALVFRGRIGDGCGGRHFFVEDRGKRPPLGR